MHIQFTFINMSAFAEPTGQPKTTLPTSRNDYSGVRVDRGGVSLLRGVCSRAELGKKDCPNL